MFKTFLLEAGLIGILVVAMVATVTLTGSNELSVRPTTKYDTTYYLTPTGIVTVIHPDNYYVSVDTSKNDSIWTR
jgi:hypothetical protein